MSYNSDEVAKRKKKYGENNVTEGGALVSMSSSINPNEQDAWKQPEQHEGKLNPKTGMYESEVNPQVREEFESKYGKGSTFGYRGKRGFASEEEYKKLSPEQRKQLDEEINKQIIEEHNKKEGTFSKILDYVPLVGPMKKNIELLGDRELREATPTSEILKNQGRLLVDAAMVGATAGTAIGAAGAAKAAAAAESLTISQAHAGARFGLTAEQSAAALAKGISFREMARTTPYAADAAKTILGIKTASLAKIGIGTAVSGIVAGDFITNWMSVDNVLGQIDTLTRDMAGDMGSMTPEKRADVKQTAENLGSLIEIAEDKVRTSAILNPLVWPFAKAWLNKLEVSNTARKYYYDQIQNYDPMMDQWSNERRGYA
jgi:hypothetical protein